MDRNEQSRWRPTGTQVLWLGISVVGLFAAIVVFGGYYFEWKWTGFPKRTPWDWVDLLIVPIVLALGGYLFTRTENRRTQEIANQRAKDDRDIADQRAKTDRDIADQRRQDDTLQAYLDQMGQLLLYEVRPLRTSNEDDEIRTLARARTLTVLELLDAARKKRVLRFLGESTLIQKEEGANEEHGTRQPVINLSGAALSNAALSNADLRGANLSNADLSPAYLSGVNLSNANLSNADLIDADLHDADLHDADLRGADLRNADLHDADLSAANLRNADLSPAYLRNANLNNADLYDADLHDADLSNTNLSNADLRQADLSNARGVTEEQLKEQAQTLEGATMPDGQKYEEWIKGREEAGENNSPS